MIQRNINPKPRFVTLTSGPSTGALVGVPLATLYKAAFFRFPQDSIIHYVLVNSTLTGNGALSQGIGSIAYGQGDQTTGRDLMSAPVPQRVLCGNAFKQFLEKRGIIFEPQSNLLFTFTNLTAAANNITLALHGYKIIL